MSGIKISELPLLENPANEDILVFVHNNGVEDVTMQGTVGSVLDMLKPFTINSFTITPRNSVIGTTINSVMLSWSFSKAVSGITISGVTNPILPTDTSLVVAGPFTSGVSFTISAISKSGETASRSVGLSFSNYRYFGVSPLQVLTDVDVLQMNKELASNNAKDINYDCTGGNYFVYAFPKAFGNLTANTKVNNFPWNDWVLQEIDITNGAGYTETYLVYRSFNLLNSASIPVSWR